MQKVLVGEAKQGTWHSLFGVHGSSSHEGHVLRTDNCSPMSLLLIRLGNLDEPWRFTYSRSKVVNARGTLQILHQATLRGRLHDWYTRAAMVYIAQGGSCGRNAAYSGGENDRINMLDQRGGGGLSTNYWYPCLERPEDAQVLW